MNNKQKSIVEIAKSRDYKIYFYESDAIQNKDVLSFKKNKKIYINASNTNERNARFLIAYHLCEKIENSIIYQDALYDEKIYYDAINLLVLETDLDNEQPIANKYDISIEIVKAKKRGIRK